MKGPGCIYNTQEGARGSCLALHWWKSSFCSTDWCFRSRCLCYIELGWPTSCIHVQDTPRQWATLPCCWKGGNGNYWSSSKMVPLHCRPAFYAQNRSQSVAFMFHNRKCTKVKNHKIQDWRLELASFSYTVKYRPGKDNVAPDSFTRAFTASLQTTSLSEIHVALCHPGFTWMLHFVRSKNLPYSTKVRVCAELKPQFYRPEQGGATQPMTWLSIDFKGPLSTSTHNPYILTVVDEYSRFPFAFACPNMHSSTVIKCLEQIFTFCRMPGFIHSGRGVSFLSEELKEYLSQRGIATSKTTFYHPIGNGQV